MFLIKGLQALFGKKSEVRESVDLVVEVSPRADRGGTLARVRVSGASYRDYAIPDAPKLDANPDALWVPCGESVRVGPYLIPGGLFYCGKGLRSVGHEHVVEPALVNPELKIDEHRPNRSGESVQYRPSYSELSPGSRAAYLEWLAGGRRDPGAHIGYVFVFFYGLERRLFADASTSRNARLERQIIAEEVNRLLGIYGANSSFRGYATSLLDAASIVEPAAKAYLSKPPSERQFEVSFGVRLALAQLVADEKPISWEWALAWLRQSPEGRFRTPSERCPGEFESLFAVRYRAAYGEGIRLKPNKTKLQATYRAASASMGSFSLPLPDLPDIAALTAPLKRIQAVADGCMDELDAYSRWLGKNPDRRDSAAGASLLPAELLSGMKESPLAPMKNFLDHRVGQELSGIIGVPEILMYWPLSSEKATVGKAESVALAQTLEKLGFGMEPDVRFGGSTLDLEGSIAVFRLPPDHPSVASPSYRAATLLLHLSAMVSAADGVAEAEREHLEATLERSLGLQPAERVRLAAHLAWVLHAQPGTAGIKKRVGALAASYRNQIGDFLVGVALADGNASPEEISSLTRIFKLLDLDADSVFSKVHALSTGGSLAATGGAGDAAKREGVRGVALDMSVIESKLAETAAVSALLSGIFVEEESAATSEVVKLATPYAATASEGTAFGSLDGKHSALLTALVTKAAWTRDEAERLAAGQGIMLDGALELINDFAFNKWNEALVEGDDPIELNTELARELSA